jgi:phosphoglycerol transferase
MDIFPTTLAALGFEIEGDRLGLGTNLFSDKPTLWEELGGDRASYDWLEAQIQKDSEYYKENFVNKVK